MPTSANAHISPLGPHLAFDLCQATEAAAVAASRWIGRGDRDAADQAAVDAMRRELNAAAIDGIIVIGEGERDQAPMLHIGETVGGGGPKVAIAVDPLEGTTITACGGPGALAVAVMAECGGLLRAPDVYMDKLAVGPGVPPETVDLDATIEDNLKALAATKRVDVTDLTVCVLDRPRHQHLIDGARRVGARVALIGDGDVVGALSVVDPGFKVDMYVGQGGAPEGVLAAAALGCRGGWMQGRLVFRNDDERARGQRWGIVDLDKKYELSDMARGDVIFAATGVTDGPLLRGVRQSGDSLTTHSVVMRSRTMRWIETRLNPGDGV